MLELPKRLRIQVEKRYLLWLHLPKTKAIGAKDAGVPSAFAQSADWNLTINFINVPYGTDRINVHVNGPFSSSPIASDVIATGPSPSTTLTISGSDVPSGYTYKVCASATALGFLAPTCESYTADGNDQTVQITPD